MAEERKFVDLLGSAYKAEVLRLLLDRPDYQFTITEIAEEVSGSYNAVKGFLEDLSKYGLVKFQKKGNVKLAEYNRSSRYHQAVKMMFAVDTTQLWRTAEEYARELVEETGVGDMVEAVILFGSVARESAHADSDIDILILADEDDVETVETKARQLVSKHGEFTNVVPVVESVQEFKQKLKDGERFETNVKRDGKVFQGRMPRG